MGDEQVRHRNAYEEGATLGGRGGDGAVRVQLQPARGVQLGHGGPNGRLLKVEALALGGAQVLAEVKAPVIRDCARGDHAVSPAIAVIIQPIVSDLGGARIGRGARVVAAASALPLVLRNRARLLRSCACIRPSLHHHANRLHPIRSGSRSIVRGERLRAVRETSLLSLDAGFRPASW